MKFNLVFKRGTTTVNTVIGQREWEYKDLTPEDAQEMIRAENFLEKLTGVRVHINGVGHNGGK